MQQAAHGIRAVGDGMRRESDNVDSGERGGGIIIAQDGARDELLRGLAGRQGFTRAVAVAALGVEVHVAVGARACGAEVGDAGAGVLDVAADEARGLEGGGGGVWWGWRLGSTGGGGAWGL